MLPRVPSTSSQRVCKSIEEFAADIPLTLGHHLGRGCLARFVFRDLFLPWVTLSCKAESRVVHGQIDVF